MTTVNSTQPSFSSGIISTELFSRIDFSKLQSGLKQCENFEIRPAGGATFRTGTKFISTTKTETDPVALIPFSMSRDLGYCLEFGNNYIRVYKDGEQVQNNGSPVEIVTTYSSSELKEIKYAQENNKMFIVHQNHKPAVLTCTSDTSWSLADLVFNPNVLQVTSVTIAKETAKDPSTVVDYDAWQYAVSVEYPDGNEGLAVKSNVITSDIDLVNQNITVTISATGDIPTGSNILVYRIYRGEFYFVYKIPYVSGTTSYTLKDIGFAQDTTRAIKEEFTEFTTNNYPATVGFWNQRLIFANTQTKPNTIWGSRVGTYDDFTNTVLNLSDEAFELTLNSSTSDSITDVVTMDDLIVMTNSKIWRIVGTSPSNMQAYIESYSGASCLRPFVYKKSILYVDSSMNTVSNFIYSYELNGYTGQNLDVLCRGLLDGYSIVDLSFRDTPFGVLYAVRNDGVLLGLTYLKEENVYAWHQHKTDGSFENVCCIDKSLNDDVYVVVNRDGKKYIEIFQKQIDITEDVDDSWHLDCATKRTPTNQRYAWKNDSATGQATTIYTKTKKPILGTDVYLDPTLPTVSGKTNNFSDETNSVKYGKYWYKRDEEHDYLDVINYIDVYRFRGQYVTVVADGNEYKNVEVKNSGAHIGRINLPIYAATILVGLPYDGYLEPIPVDVSLKNSGTTVGLNRRITKATIRYYRSRGLWYGANKEKLYQIKTYTQENFAEPIPLETNVLNTDIPDTYKTETSFVIAQKSPFPAFIQSITLGINYGEKN